MGFEEFDQQQNGLWIIGEACKRFREGDTDLRAILVFDAVARVRNIGSRILPCDQKPLCRPIAKHVVRIGRFKARYGRSSPLPRAATAASTMIRWSG